MKKRRAVEASKKLEDAKANIMAKKCGGGDCDGGVPYAERVSELLAENGYDPSTMKVKKKLMEQTMRGFKHIGLDVVDDVKLDGNPFKAGASLEFEKDDFQLSMDIEKDVPVSKPKQQKTIEVTHTINLRDIFPENDNGDKKDIEMREVAFDSETGVSTVVINMTDK